MQTNPIHSIEWSERFVNLSFDGLQLLIPQTDVYSLEPTVDMTPTNTSVGSVGQLKQGQNVWSLYALSADLTVLNSCPDIYHIVILMKNIQPVYGLLCEQVDTIDRNQLSIYPLPAVMKTENSPLLALAIHGEQVRYISSASALSRLFPQ